MTLEKFWKYQILCGQVLIGDKGSVENGYFVVPFCQEWPFSSERIFE